MVSSHSNALKPYKICIVINTILGEFLDFLNENLSGLLLV